MNDPSTPSPAYEQCFERNRGILSAEQQQSLRRADVTVFGAGGVGGSAFEILVRTGIGRFRIVDNDRFEASNLNRQVFATRETLGRPKVAVAAEWARTVHPEVEVETFDRVDEGNIDRIVDGADAAVLGIDSVGPCIIASRRCRQQAIPLIEGWAIPFQNARVFTPQTPTLEEVYALGTEGRSVDAMAREELAGLMLKVFAALGAIEGVRDHFQPDAEDRIRRGAVPSFGPIVRLTAAMVALETVKVLLGWEAPSLAPRLAMYDPFAHRQPAAGAER